MIKQKSLRQESSVLMEAKEGQSILEKQLKK
jgi:hypothetical protein